MDDQAFKALEHEIREFYDYLGMKVHQRTIPLYLVNEQEMKESKARDGKNVRRNSVYNYRLAFLIWLAVLYDPLV